MDLIPLISKGMQTCRCIYNTNLSLICEESFDSLRIYRKGSFDLNLLQVQNLTISRLCNRQVITAVNGSLPGPRIRVREGDTLIVHVYNKSPYNLSLHWLVLIMKILSESTTDFL